MTAERYKLPKGWVKANFEQCIDIPEGPFVKVLRKNYLSQGKFPIIDQSSLFIAGYTDKKEELFKGKLPVIIFGDHTRIFKFVDFYFAIGADGTKILKAEKNIEPKYLFYYLKSIELPSRGYSRHYRYLRKNKILLAPKNEQKRIVQKIEILLGHLNKTRQELAKIPPLTKKFRRSVLAKAFTGELTKEWRDQQENLEPASALLARIREERKKKLDKKYREPEPIDTSSLPELPGEWEWTRTKEIGEVVTGSTPKTQVSEYWNGNIVWLTPKDLGRNNSKYISDSKRRITQKGYKSCSTKLIPKNSIVLSTRAPIGHVSVVQVDFCTNQGCKSIIPAKEICSDYLYYLLLHNRKHLQSLGSGTTFSELAKDKLENFLVPLPCFIEEPEIVKRIEALFARADSIEKAVQAVQAHSEKLTQSIFAKAFRGELVEHNPEDEPASILLKKIKTEKSRRSLRNCAKEKYRSITRKAD